MRNSRKMEHIHHALRLSPSGDQGLDDVHPVPDNLPDLSAHDISLEVRIGELALSSPIVINAMTGGARETEAINRGLAEAAAECGIAMAVGSQMAALRDPGVTSSYRVVREVNPKGKIFANLGGEATPDQAKAAVDMLEADALQIHLNVMQELIMPEGDRDFGGTARRIESIVRTVGVPVIVKEVGFGISAEAARKLKDIGVSVVDVGGRGGTDFAAIENARRGDPYEWLGGWGLRTSVALLETGRHYPPHRIIASGGIANSLDIAKALALGSSAAAMAGVLLRVLQTEGTEALAGFLRQTEDGLRKIMTALGASSVSGLWDVPLVITGHTAEWGERRGIDLARYALRPHEKRSGDSY